MSEEVRKYHEEDAIGKTYDLRIARRLLRYLRPYWALAAAALVLTLLTNVLISTQPYFTKMAVDDFITPRQTDGIWLFSLAFFGVFLFRFIFSYVQEILLNTVGQRVMFDLRTELFTKLQHQELAYFDQYPVGRTMTRLTSDVDALNELFTSGVIDVLGDLVVIIAIIGIMFWLDWKLAVVSLITVPLLFITTNWFRKHARRGFDRVRTRNAKLNAFLQEYISGAQTVQLFNAEEKALSRFREINDDYRQANIETIFYYSVFYPLVDFIGAVGIAVVIFAFGYEYLGGLAAAGTALTVGILAAFIQYSLQLFQPIRDLSDKFNVLQAAIVASHRIFILLDREVEITSPEKPRKTGKVTGSIEFENVWFAYKGDDWVLKDVSFKVDVGESIALVGHTGSGKTTITNLIMRFYDVQLGRILVDGVDVRSWDLHDLRSSFAVVLQDVFLFSGSIANNIRLGNDTISDERVGWAAREVHADSFIERLDGGFASEVRERGAGLSVGQKQLVSFARALAFDPKILILDEATSSIDTETEQLIQQAVERVMGGRTSLVVAHRLSTIQKCDRILVMHHGELREAGTHNELLQLRGLYWRLYQLQYSDEKLHISQDALSDAGELRPSAVQSGNIRILLQNEFISEYNSFIQELLMLDKADLEEGGSECPWSGRAVTVERVAEANLPTRIGDFKIAGYRSLSSDEEFVVLYKGEMERDVPTLVRIHSQCLTGDVFGSIKCDCGPQLQSAMEMIENEGRGAIVYQQQEGRGIGIINKIRAYALQDEGADTVEANEKLGFEVDAREYQQCAEILFDLGLCKVKVISNNPDKLAALEDAGLEIVERIPLEIPAEAPAAHYLRVKKQKLGHLLT